MGAKIQADEISSIIKERIDNFELNIDEKTIINKGLEKKLRYYSSYHKKFKKKKT